MSGIQTPTSRQLFNNLINADASALVLDDTTKTVESNGTMAFRSGLNRVFGVGKSSDDIAANQRTLTFLLDHIKNETNDGVYQRVLNSKLRLGGDGDDTNYTVQQRLQRGSYVSSELVSQLKAITGQAVTDHKAEQQRLATNNQVVDRIMGKGVPQSGIQDVVDEICTEGTEDIPADQKQFWDFVRDYWKNGNPNDGGQRDKYFSEAETKLRSAAKEVAEQGDTISEPKIKANIKSAMLLEGNMARLVDLYNSDMIRQMTPQTIADDVRLWSRATDDKDITQNDCDWLANELQEASDLLAQNESPGRLSMPDGEGLFDRLKGLLGRPDDKHDRGVLLNQIADTILTEAKQILPPSSLTNQQRAQWLNGKLQDRGPYAVIQQISHPKPFTPQDIARMMGESVKPIMLEHRQQIERLQQQDLQAFRKNDEALRSALDQGDYRRLLAMKKQCTSEEFGQLGQPTTVAGFCKALLMVSIESKEYERAVTSAKDRNNNLDDPEVMKDVITTAKMNAKIQEQILDQFLPVLDDATEFEREVHALRTGPGGLAGADTETLRRLDAKAKDLAERGGQLLQHVPELADQYGVAKDVALAIWSGAREVSDKVKNYRRDSDFDVRQEQVRQQELSQIQANFDEISKDLESLFGDVKADQQRANDVPWAREGMKRQLAPFPELRTLAQNATDEQVRTLKSRETLTHFMQDMLLIPAKTELTNRLMPKPPTPEGFLEAQRRATEMLDKPWDQGIEPGITALGNYADLEQDVQRLGGREGLAKLTPDDRNALRQQAQDALKSVETIQTAANRLIQLLPPDKLPVGEFAGAMLAGADKIAVDARALLEALDQADRSPRNNVTSTNPFDNMPPQTQPRATSPNQRPTPSTNPFDDMPPQTQPRATSPNQRPTPSTNPFDDMPPQTQPRATSPNQRPTPSTNPFDNMPPQTQPRATSPNQRPTPSTNPFDDMPPQTQPRATSPNQRPTPSTNPFDDMPPQTQPRATLPNQRPTPSTNPFDDMPPQTQPRATSPNQRPTTSTNPFD